MGCYQWRSAEGPKGLLSPQISEIWSSKLILFILCPNTVSQLIIHLIIHTLNWSCPIKMILNINESYGEVVVRLGFWSLLKIWALKNLGLATPLAVMLNYFQTIVFAKAYLINRNIGDYFNLINQTIIVGAYIFLCSFVLILIDLLIHIHFFFL